MTTVPTFLILFMVSLSAYPHQTIWQEFSSPDGKFSVLMPNAPERNKLLTPTSKGVLETVSFNGRDARGNQFSVSYTDVKIGDKPAPLDKLFDKTRDALLQSFEGRRLVKESPASLDGHEGRTITIKKAEDEFVTYQFFLINQRFYQLTVETKGLQEDARDSQSFLNSFKLR